MSNPSLILPQSPAYAVSNVYAAQVYDGEVPVYDVLPLTFTRASGGSRINTSGFVEQMGTNIPRVTYPVNGGCGALLLEKQSTNLALYSEQFDNAWWNKGNGSITANSTTSPDGTINADKFVEDSTNNNHYFGDDTTSATSGQLVTFTIFAKASERSWIAMRLYNGNGSIFGWYNIGSGTLGTIGGGGIASITAMGNGWYRCALTITMASSSVFLPYVFSSTGNGVLTYTGTSGSGVFVWGAQAEQSSYPTSYISTTSSSVTRIADACYKTGISNLIGQTEGTIFLDIQNYKPTAQYHCFLGMSVSSSIASNHIYIGQNYNYLTLFIRASGTYSVIESNLATLNGRAKIAFAYGSSFGRMYLNGTQVYSSSAPVIPSGMNKIELNVFNTTDDTGNGEFNETILFPTKLTNAQLATLTTL